MQACVSVLKCVGLSVSVCEQEGLSRVYVSVSVL